jgi:dihydrofolate reductase
MAAAFQTDPTYAGVLADAVSFVLLLTAPGGVGRRRAASHPGGPMNDTRAPGRSVVLQVSALSVDGFVCESGSAFETWADPISDPECVAWMVASLWRAGVHVMGGTTFQDMSAYWPGNTGPFSAVMNSIPKVGFSRTLTETTWADSRIVSGDLAEEIEALRGEGEGEIIAHGGAVFARALAAADLVDEYRLIVYPYVAATGARLFEQVPGGLPLALESCTSFPSGLVAMVYRRERRSGAAPNDMAVRRTSTHEETRNR